MGMGMGMDTDMGTDPGREQTKSPRGSLNKSSDLGGVNAAG